MKKVFSLLAVLAVTVFMASSSVWAATEFAKKVARVTFTAEDLTFNVSLFTWKGSGSYDSGQTVATQITFPPSDVTLGTTAVSESISKEFALITSNINQQAANTMVYVFTDNKNNTSDFVAVSSGTDGFNGLVRKGQGSTYVDGDYATILTKCLKVSSATANYSGTNGPRDASFDPDHEYSGDRWLADKSTPGFNNEKNVIAKGGTTGGIYVGSQYNTFASNWYSGAESVVMFFKGFFHSVNGGDQYGTDTITFKTAVE